MKVIVVPVTEDPDERGTDLLKGVKSVSLQGLTPNQVRALLLLFNHVGGGEETTLRGEVTSMHYKLLEGLGVPHTGAGRGHSSPAWHETARRYMNRSDIVEGAVTFLKGGAHV